MEVKLFDHQKNELALGDVIIQHFPNPKCKIVGVLEYNSTAGFFYLSDLKEGKFKFYIDYAKNEKLCSIKERPELKKCLGRHDKITPKTLAKLF